MTSIMNSTVSPLSKNPFDKFNGSQAVTNSTDGADAIQDRFLKLLVAQLRTQDPLDPMDNSQITSQMAQISQVTGVQQLNQTMQSLVQAQTASQSLMAATMVGHNVMVEGNQLACKADGRGVSGGVMLDAHADQVTIDIKDKSGHVVDSLTLTNVSPGFANFSWDGTDQNKNPLPAGAYTFDVQAMMAGSDGRLAVTATPYMNQVVEAVAWDTTGKPQLVLANEKRVTLSDVVQLS